MSKLYFRYGAMNCGKSTALMQVAHNYEEKHKRIVLIKPIIDTKAEDRISSRIGLERKVDILLGKDESLKKYYGDFISDDIACILVDEAQFLERSQVDELWEIAELLDIPVICYGLRTDFQSKLFTGSERLLEVADELEELITICDCGRRAKFNSRFVDDKFTMDGESILIDNSKSNVEYRPLCGKCYIKKIKELK